MELSLLFDRIEWSLVFSMVGLLLSLVTLIFTARTLRNKLQAQDSLVSILSTDENFVSVLESMHLSDKSKNPDHAELDKLEVEELQRLIADRVAALEPAKRKLLEESLLQSSATGRARYVSGIAKYVDVRLHQAA